MTKDYCYRIYPGKNFTLQNQKRGRGFIVVFNFKNLYQLSILHEHGNIMFGEKSYLVVMGLRNGKTYIKEKRLKKMMRQPGFGLYMIIYFNNIIYITSSFTVEQNNKMSGAGQTANLDVNEIDPPPKRLAEEEDEEEEDPLKKEL